MEDLIELTNWARIEFKPAKSTSLVLKKGRVQDQFWFKIGENIIPTVQEQPVECLGKWHRADLKDRQSMKEMLIQAETWVMALENSGQQGKYLGPGVTNMGCCPDCSGHSWFMRYLSP